MAHEVETMAYANQVPWHGLGANVSDDLTPEEFAEAAGLNWRLDLKPLRAVIDDKTTVEVPGRFALVRDTDNRVMTVTGKVWKPVQPIDTLKFFDDYIRAGGAKLETAGSLRDGKVVWALAKLEHSFTVGGRKDQVNGFMLFTSPNEVGKSIQIRTTTVRVVCANTHAWAMRRSDLNYNQNHLTEFDVEAAKARVGEAHEALGMISKQAKRIAALKLSMEDVVTKVFQPVFLPDYEEPACLLDPDAQPKAFKQLLASYETAPGATPGNGWGAYNAVTHYADHVAGRERDTRLFRSWVGDMATAKDKTWDTLLELAA